MEQACCSSCRILYRFDIMIYAWHVKWQEASKWPLNIIKQAHTATQMAQNLQQRPESQRFLSRHQRDYWWSWRSQKRPAKHTGNVALTTPTPIPWIWMDLGGLNLLGDFTLGLTKWHLNASHISHLLKARCGMFVLSDVEWRWVKMSEGLSHSTWITW